MKKRVLYTELCYALGLVIMAFAAAFTAVTMQAAAEEVFGSSFRFIRFQAGKCP